VKRWLKLLKLPRSQLRALTTAFILLSLVRLGLWLIPFQRLYDWLKQRSQATAGTRVMPSSTDRPVRLVTWAVETSSEYMLGQPKCLAKALCVFFLLRRRGIDPVLRLGVMKEENSRLAAHAWIEVQGQVVIGALPNLTEYVPLPSL
jgi:hypothetical protein